ncbi:MAG: hypothetical protein HC898_06455 [Phycisphaerales bacterium]|nr:hypothetical protein [Phycisphaerales bacterium]
MLPTPLYLKAEALHWQTRELASLSSGVRRTDPFCLALPGDSAMLKP